MIAAILSWTPAALWAAFIVFLSSRSELPVRSAFPGMDKVGHFLLFAVLGAALAWGGRRFQGRGPHLTLLAVGILFAASDELHQSFVPQRTPSVGDFVADVLGLVAGYLVLGALLKSWRSWSTTPDPPGRTPGP